MTGCEDWEAIEYVEAHFREDVFTDASYKKLKRTLRVRHLI
jgi:hypothetical protein